MLRTKLWPKKWVVNLHTIYLLTDTYLIRVTFIEQQFFEVLCECGYDGEFRIHYFWLWYRVWIDVFTMRLMKNMKNRFLTIYSKWKVTEYQKIRTIIFLTLSKMVRTRLWPKKNECSSRSTYIFSVCWLF